MYFSKRILATSGVLYLLSQIFFLINIQFPRGHNFDEFHYVPAAKQILAFKENQNWEHPPLAKILMAVGIAAWGDRPIGWRFMSTVFGALTLVGIYVWALALFRSERAALFAAVVTLFNQLLYVQARIGMLDTFMFAFIVWGLAAFTAAWNPRLPASAVRPRLLATGLFMGLATACKWFAVVPWVMCLGLVALVRLLQSWKTTFAESHEDDWYHPKLWEGIRLIEWVACLIILPIAVYLLTFIPYFLSQPSPFHVSDLWLSQKKMWEGQLRVVNSHPYMSQWTDWAVLKRPIWYAFDKEGANKVRGVLLLGNPLVMWGGLLALLICGWGWVRKRGRDVFLIVATFSALYFSWAIIPRRVAFYYYYYPAGMVLSLAVTYVFSAGREGKGAKLNWAAAAYVLGCVALFVHFFPILAALKIDSDKFMKWMWFREWI